jgi:hypothetical protein
MDHKEKLEEAKRLYETANADQKYVLESLFPELRESEDERIRKALIEGFKVMKDGSYGECTFSNYNIPVTDIITWLEKQGDINPTEDELEALRIAAYEPTKNWSEKLQSLYEKLAHCDRGEQDRVRPQSQWKPSDKDIFELQCVINNDPYNGFILKALLEQLKKLREE